MKQRRRTCFDLALRIAVLGICLCANAQESAKIPTLGYLATGSAGTSQSAIEPFREGLRELGYFEGKNIKIEYRYADGQTERLSLLARELVRIQVAIIITQGGSQPVQAAKQATNSIPIVFPGVADPVAFGLVSSLARPGGNLTGLTNYSPELSGKRIELLKEILPKLSRVAVLRDPRLPTNSFQETQKAAQALGIKVQSLEVQASSDVETAAASLDQQGTEAIIVLPHSVLSFYRKRILELTGKHRLPATYPDKEWVDAGGLMSYGPDARNIRRRAAIYVDKILKGAKPSDLPVEQPTKFEFIVNLKTAKQIGLTIPPNVLVRADKVIK
jgi:putative tryptophan/tyrosine transport system substrate-binding protein